MKADPVSKKIISVKMPGSKSYTQRALVVSALAVGTSRLKNILISDDTNYLMEGLRDLGAQVSITDDEAFVKGTGGHIQNPNKKIFLGNNGTALRFLTTLVSLGKGEYIVDGEDRLRERPVKPLIDVLAKLGVTASTKEGKGYPPVTIHANGLHGGKVVFSDLESSQYVSSLLIGAPYAQGDIEIKLEGKTVSEPYIDMTIEVMKHFGVEVIKDKNSFFCIKAGQRYLAQDYLVEGDASSASYFFLASALCGRKIRVMNINPASFQGDIGFLNIMESLGCLVTRGDSWVEIEGAPLKQGNMVFNMKDMPDMVPTLAVLSAFRPGRTVITNVPHLRIKESDRIAAPVAELRKIGIRAEETDDGMIIEGGRPHGAEIETYNDHRIAMSFAVASLVVPEIIIKDRLCVRKSFPEFWNELEKLHEL